MLYFVDFLVVSSCLLFFGCEIERISCSASRSESSSDAKWGGRVCRKRMLQVFFIVGGASVFSCYGRATLIKNRQLTRFDATRGFPGEDIMFF